MRLLSLVTSILFISLSTPAFAGMSTSADGPLKFTVEETASFAKKVEKSLALKGARVAIVSRVGRNPEDLPLGIHYTHVAFWVYSKIKTADGRTIPGYHIYSLYQRSEELDKSDLVKDFPVDYFLGVEEMKAGIIIPKPGLQKALLKVLLSDAYNKLHNPSYSVVASPFNNQYQNCTEHTLDILLSALYNTDDMDQLKVNAKEYFTPQTVHLSPLKAIFGPLLVQDFKTGDHENEIQTVTFTTINKFMRQYDLAQAGYTVKKDVL